MYVTFTASVVHFFCVNTSWLIKFIIGFYWKSVSIPPTSLWVDPTEFILKGKLESKFNWGQVTFKFFVVLDYMIKLWVQILGLGVHVYYLTQHIWKAGEEASHPLITTINLTSRNVNSSALWVTQSFQKNSNLCWCERA